ncbi:hypothetical protein XCR1_3010001 [Xenorhabdus cabanillasii JM26]|uniref:Uncharacterized protein n=1 Tax=Xenorhabdus cabanillasii JM26 TaxID=1427517 RepID=W1J9Z7_9GAMM|nr:hypothetical protein XCR1_3010001 [Xenorhabdus cabanillasii JM26]
MNSNAVKQYKKSYKNKREVKKSPLFSFIRSKIYLKSLF